MRRIIFIKIIRKQARCSIHNNDFINSIKLHLHLVQQPQDLYLLTAEKSSNAVNPFDGLGQISRSSAVQLRKDSFFYGAYRRRSGSEKDRDLMDNNGKSLRIRRAHHPLPEITHSGFKLLFCLMLLSLIMIASLSSPSLAEDPDIAVQPPNLEGIWTINLGSEQVTMMIRQHESR